MRLVLASQSPARFSTLTRAGVMPEVIVSGADEEAVTAESPAELVAKLARVKAEAVVAGLGPEVDAVVLACDSMLEFDDHAYGKPRSAAEAAARWRAMRGRSGSLLTGHHVVRLRPGLPPLAIGRVASTRVFFADVSDREIEAYVATGEPQKVAGRSRSTRSVAPSSRGSRGTPTTSPAFRCPCSA